MALNYACLTDDNHLGKALIRLMPVRAPCAEVVEEVTAQKKIVRVAKLISELAAATAAPAAATALAGRATVAPKLAALTAAPRKIADRIKPEVLSRQRTQTPRDQSKSAPQTAKVEKNPAGPANAAQKRVAAAR